MNSIKKFCQVILIIIFLSSCRTSINKEYPLKDLRQNLKKMHLEVTEELILPKPDDVKKLMNKMDKLLELIELK